MKIFFKLLLIFLLAFFSLDISTCRAEYNPVSLTHTSFSSGSEKVFFNAQPHNETSIATSNSNEHILVSVKSNDDNSGTLPGNSFTDNNIYIQQFKVYSDRIVNSKSHNISSYLKNEICVRAP